MPEIDGRLFPQLNVKVADQPLVYLDSAATTLKPLPVIEAVDKYYREQVANVHRGAHSLSGQGTGFYEGARERVRAFINAPKVSEIVFTRGTTESLNLVAQSYAAEFLKAGDEVLLTEMEHHSNIVPWQLAAKRSGFKIRALSLTSAGEIDLEQFEKLLTPKVKLASFVWISNALGTVNPILEMTKLCRERGIITVVDAAQGLAARPTDVRKIGCDFLAFSAHKIFAPTGLGVLYGREELLNKMPPYQGGGSMISRVSFYGTDYLPAPQRFEAGTPHIAGVIGLDHALQFVSSLGFEKIRQIEEPLVSQIIKGLKEIPGVRLIGQAADRANVVSFIMEGTHPSDVGQILDQMGIAVRTGHHCCQPLMDRFGITGTIRAAVSVYTRPQDVEAFLKGVLKAREILL